MMYLIGAFVDVGEYWMSLEMLLLLLPLLQLLSLSFFSLPFNATTYSVFCASDTRPIDLVVEVVSPVSYTRSLY